ncbi:MAG TPA: PEP-CTERM sorting domain-containing protein [Tepidisphaeraceae bacterium]|jgi:hypothetical protein|nr:PEP-CTERM sorting domain-containing protein [Tepidisphaeraceae bacterium]
MRPTVTHLWVLSIVISSMLAGHAGAIVLADKTTRNKTAPTGWAAGSGWQFEGLWDGFTGTPIAKNYFITASHVGGSVGDSLVLGGKSYKTVAMYDDPNSDLRIWKTSANFGSWASIYTGTGEVGKIGVLYGRGTIRGNAINVNGTAHGWGWGSSDDALSWGENKFKGFLNGGFGIGQVIAYSFDRTGHGDHVSNEGIVSAGDSSGGVFVNNNGKWQLAAINYSIQGPFSTTPGGSTFLGSMFDTGGLYSNGVLTPDTVTDVPGLAYATRISSNQSWINSVLNGKTVKSAAIATGTLVPEPGSVAILLTAVGGMMMRRRRV